LAGLYHSNSRKDNSLRTE